MIVEINGSNGNWGVSFGPFLKKGFNFAILQVLRKLPNLIEMLLSSLIGFDKTHEQSLRKRPENSSIPAALQAVVIFDFFFFFLM